MRKFFIFLCLFLPMMSAHAYNCTAHKMAINTLKDSNEYLYANASDYAAKVSFECGNTQGCGSGFVVLMPSGHYFEGDQQNFLYRYLQYQCDGSGGYSWEGYYRPECQIGKKYIRNSDFDDVYSLVAGTQSHGAWSFLPDAGVCKQPANTCFSTSSGKFFWVGQINGDAQTNAYGTFQYMCAKGSSGIDWYKHYSSCNSGYKLEGLASTTGVKECNKDPDAICNKDATNWSDIKYWDQTPKKVKCSRFTSPDLKSVKQHGNECYARCVNGSVKGAVKKCKDGYKKQKQSEFFDNGYYTECQEIPKTNLQKCLESRPNSPEGQACCYLNDAKWTQVDGQYKCVCNDSSKEFQIGDDKRGKCVPRTSSEPQPQPTEPNAVVQCELLDGTKLDVGASLYGPDQTALMLDQCKTYVPEDKITDKNGTGFIVVCRDGGNAVCKAVKCPDTENFVLDKENGICTPVVKKFECDKESLSLLGKWSVDYSDEESIVTAISDVQAYCKDDARTADGLNEKMTALRTMIREINQAREHQRKLAQQLRDVNAELNAMNAGLGQSHWKNEEGKFNTARLASDSIAGVVLGTAGGLITSNIMKKNQVSGGFEKLQCVIGGQTVAGWGDEFMVGRRQ